MQLAHTLPNVANELNLPFLSEGVVEAPSAETFFYSIDTTLKHSNATQNVYFSNYFEWQGYCRERWFFECISKDMLATEGVFVTKNAHNNYIKEAFPFQTVLCSMNTFHVQRCSFYLLFKFSIDGELTATGYQQVAFANHKKRIHRMPESVIEKIKRYEIHV